MEKGGGGATAVVEGVLPRYSSCIYHLHMTHSHLHMVLQLYPIWYYSCILSGTVLQLYPIIYTCAQLEPVGFKY